MSKKYSVIWDTTQFPGNYPIAIKNIYFNCNLKNRKSFTSWIGNANSIFLKDLDWWSTAPVSRNIYVSDLFHQICVIETIKELLKSNTNFDIIVESPQLEIILRKILKKKNFKIRVNKKFIF